MYIYAYKFMHIMLSEDVRETRDLPPIEYGGLAQYKTPITKIGDSHALWKAPIVEVKPSRASFDRRY